MFLNPRLALLTAGFLSLFLELALIRWLPAHVTSLAYFSNIVLIAAFVGLGIGFLMPPAKRDRFDFFLPVLLFVVAASGLMQYVNPVIPNVPNELLWSIYFENVISQEAFHLDIIPTLAIVFVLTALPFILLGDKIGSLMRTFQRPLDAYALEISGSILGILAFTLLAFIGGIFSTPTVWFAIAAVLALLVSRTDVKYLALGAVSAAVLIALVFGVSKDSLWSPYYRIDLAALRSEQPLEVFANRFFFQRMVDFETSEAAREKYSYPYNLHKPKSVLVLGSGSGNDVATALLTGAEKIDAVEIDPTIASFGYTKHPQKPYLDSRVTLYIDDARSFLENTDTTYDMVVMGTLDAHALLSARSTVRLDNYVYTIESLQAVKEHINEQGMVVLQFSVPEVWLAQKLVKTTQVVFGSENAVVLQGSDLLFNLAILAGPAVNTLRQANPDGYPIAEEISERDVPRSALATDDWPYLYLKERSISSYYLEAIALLFVLASGAIVALLRRSAVAMFSWESGIYFALGAGFLLLETKSITTLSLLFGSTWLVNSFVFASILAMVLAANFVISRLNVRVEIPYALLFVSLGVNYFIPVSMFLGGGLELKILGTGLVALPIFFASLIFSTHFKHTSNIRVMFGINLLGAVLGGLLEYSSMLTGLNALYIVAAVIYILSFLFHVASAEEPQSSNREV